MTYFDGVRVDTMTYFDGVRVDTMTYLDGVRVDVLENTRVLERLRRHDGRKWFGNDVFVLDARRAEVGRRLHGDGRGVLLGRVRSVLLLRLGRASRFDCYSLRLDVATERVALLIRSTR